MVHAYDFDMRVPSTPFLGTGPTSVPLQEHEGQASHILIDSSKASRTLGLSRVPKRRRDSEDPTMNASPHKILHVDSDGKASPLPPFHQQPTSVSPRATASNVRRAAYSRVTGFYAVRVYSNYHPVARLYQAPAISHLRVP